MDGRRSRRACRRATRWRLVIQKGTEVGAAAFVPFLSRADDRALRRDARKPSVSNAGAKSRRKRPSKLIAVPCRKCRRRSLGGAAPPFADYDLVLLCDEAGRRAGGGPAGGAAHSIAAARAAAGRAARRRSGRRLHRREAERPQRRARPDRAWESDIANGDGGADALACLCTNPASWEGTNRCLAWRFIRWAAK